MKKKLLLFTLPLLFISNHSMAQMNADEYSLLHPSNNQNTSIFPNVSLKSITSGPITIDGEIILCGDTETTLSVTGANFYNWYADNAHTILLGSNSDLLVSPITNDTTIYFASLEVVETIVVPLPPHESSYAGSTRGYYFQAPTDMYITKIFVPTDANSGNQSVAIMKFNSGPPPEYSSNTNDFTTLGLWQNGPTDTIFTSILIQSGDYIGVLGSRSNVNSYATGSYASSINGIPVTLNRLGMQYELSTTAPQEIWTEAAGDISRVELFYGSTSVSEIIPVQISVPQPYESTTIANYCAGDSVQIDGIYYSANTTLSNTFQTIAGCDSVVTIIVNGISLPDVTVSQSGITLTSNQSGASYEWIDCSDDSPIAGENAVSFTPTVNGTYSVIVTTNGCSDTSDCILINSVNLEKLSVEFGLTVFPNPTTSELTYSFKGEELLNYKISDLNGKLVLDGKMINNSGKIDVARLASGTYLLEAFDSSSKTVIRIVKN